MNDLDKRIQNALGRDQPAGQMTGDPNLAEEVLLAFRGRHRWLSALFLVVQIASALALAVVAMRIYEATDPVTQLRWAALAGALFMVIAMVKIWFWLEMHTNRVLREVKRVELLLVSQPRK